MLLSLSPRQLRRCTEYLRMHSRPGASAGGHGRTAATGAAEADPAADLLLVRRVLAREAGAEAELVERLACLPAMIRVQHRRMGTPLRPHELDDVVQNVLLALWRKLAVFDGRVPVLFWAAGFGTIELRRAVERRDRRPEVTGVDVAEPLAPGGDSPVDRERLDAALAVVDQTGRQIVVMKHYEGRTFDDIAARTGTFVNTVKTRYYRALERMRSWLLAGGREQGDD
jgi:RNA polymerase sigma-70 factor (ECF subfamily)